MPQQIIRPDLQSNPKNKQSIKAVWIILVLIIIVIIISGIYIWWKNIISDLGTVIKMPQPDNWDYSYISSNTQVANHVSSFLLSADNDAMRWLKEQLTISQTEKEKIKDYFDYRDYFHDKYKLRKEIILSLCIKPDKAYPLIRETFNEQVSYNHPTYPISEFAQCIIRSTQYRQETINFLQDILISSDPEEYRIKIAIAEALSDIRAQSSLPIIKKVLEQQINDFAVEYLHRSIKRIKGEEVLPFLEHGLFNGIKLNFSIDDIEDVQLVKYLGGKILLQFTEDDFPIILEHIKKGERERSTDKLMLSQEKVLNVNLKNKITMKIFYDDQIYNPDSDELYFSYSYYDRFFNPQKKNWVVFKSQGLSNLIKQKLKDHGGL